MNYLILTAGIISLFATAGHFAIGSKVFLKPVINSDIDEIPKKVMHSLFHYMSAYMILSTLVLIMTSIGRCMLFEDTDSVVKFIGMSYVGFAIPQFIIALTSSIKGGIFKLFQWVFWIIIAVLCFLGI